MGVSRLGMHRVSLSAGLLVFVVVLAGCSGVPFGEPTPQEEPAPVKLVNNATITETFEVAVIPVGENLTLTWANNTSDSTTGNISVQEGALTYKKGDCIKYDSPTRPASMVSTPSNRARASSSP